MIVAIVLLLGPLIRHFFNSRHAGKGSPWWTWAAAAAGMTLIVVPLGTALGVHGGPGCVVVAVQELD